MARLDSRKMMGEQKTESPEDFMTFNWEVEIDPNQEENDLRLIEELQEKNRAAQEAANASDR